MPVSKRLRYEILRRDNYACRYCGDAAPDVPLTVDHVIPTALGGDDQPSNLVTACRDCNSGKSASSPDAPVVDDVASDALRWAKAMQQAALVADIGRTNRDWYREVFNSAWSAWSTRDAAGERVLIERPIDWPLSIDQMIHAGISMADIEDAIDIAMRTRGVKDTFRFFCGICWRKLGAQQEIARDILSTEDNA